MIMKFDRVIRRVLLIGPQLVIRTLLGQKTEGSIKAVDEHTLRTAKRLLLEVFLGVRYLLPFRTLRGGTT